MANVEAHRRVVSQVRRHMRREGAPRQVDSLQPAGKLHTGRWSKYFRRSPRGMPPVGQVKIDIVAEGFANM